MTVHCLLKQQGDVFRGTRNTTRIHPFLPLCAQICFHYTLGSLGRNMLVERLTLANRSRLLGGLFASVSCFSAPGSNEMIDFDGTKFDNDLFASVSEHGLSMLGKPFMKVQSLIPRLMAILEGGFRYKNPSNFTLNFLTNLLYSSLLNTSLQLL